MNPCKKTVISLLVVSAFCFLARPSAAQESKQRDIKKVVAPKNPGGVELFGESHALVFGVSDYNNGLKNLPGVKDDVVAVSEVLRQHGFTVKVVMNPTREQFDQAMRDFISEHGQADQNRLLIYFAGHGHTMKNRGDMEGYLIPVDAPHPRKDEIGFRKSAIKFDFIEAYAKEINSKHALFVFDSCFSGALFNVRGDASLPSSIASVADKAVRQFIASGSADETVPDKSIFRQLFVDGINGEADLTGDGYITGTELGIFLHDKVSDYRKGAQTPQYGKIQDRKLDRGEFVFISPLPATNKVHKQISISREENKLPQIEAPMTNDSGRWVVITDESVRVEANTGWVDTGIQAKAGQEIWIKSGGSQLNLGATGYVGVAGSTIADSRKPLSGCPTGALIAKLNNEIICIKSEYRFKASSDGTIWLGVNESNLADNTGFWTVSVTVQEFRR